MMSNHRKAQFRWCGIQRAAVWFDGADASSYIYDNSTITGVRNKGRLGGAFELYTSPAVSSSGTLTPHIPTDGSPADLRLTGYQTALDLVDTISWDTTDGTSDEHLTVFTTFRIPETEEAQRRALALGRHDMRESETTSASNNNFLELKVGSTTERVERKIFTVLTPAVNAKYVPSDNWTYDRDLGSTVLAGYEMNSRGEFFFATLAADEDCRLMMLTNRLDKFKANLKFDTVRLGNAFGSEFRRPWIGGLGETLIFDHKLSPLEKEQIIAYLKAKWLNGNAAAQPPLAVTGLATPNAAQPPALTCASGVTLLTDGTAPVSFASFDSTDDAVVQVALSDISVAQNDSLPLFNFGSSALDLNTFELALNGLDPDRWRLQVENGGIWLRYNPQGIMLIFR